MKAFLLTLLSALIFSPALAHHSVAEYDRSTRHEMQGTLVGVRWRNPHVTFTVRVTDPSEYAGYVPTRPLHGPGYAQRDDDAATDAVH